MQEIILKSSLLGAVFSFSVIFLTFFTPFYNFRFESYDIYNDFEEKWSREEIDNEFSNIQKYLLPFSSSDLNPDFFSREDILHMKDVKVLYRAIYLAFAISLATSISILMIKKPLIKLSKVDLVLFTVPILLLVISAFAFSSLFNGFHEIAFNNDYWQLDPQTSNLIKYFPERIFLELTILSSLIVILTYFLFFKLLQNFSKK